MTARSERRAAEAKKRQVRKPKSVVPTLAQQNGGKTRDELAALAGVSHGTLSKVERIVSEASPEVVEATRKGEMSINAAFKTVAPKVETSAPAPMLPEPRETPDSGFAIVADVDAPEDEERATEPFSSRARRGEPRIPMSKRLFITDEEMAMLLEVSAKTLYRSLVRAPLRREHCRQIDLESMKPVAICGTRRWRVSAVAAVLDVSPEEIEARLS